MSAEQQEGAVPVTTEEVVNPDVTVSEPEPPPVPAPPRKLTPEEEEVLKKQAQEMFNMFDLDKSGHIDATDIENWYRKWNDVENNIIILTEDQIKEASAEFMKELNEMDANVDAKVTFDEFYNALLKSGGVEI
jgi:hypothetical protein